MKKNELAAMIDHTLLAPNAKVEQIIRLCQEAVRFQFASVCINPVHVSLCASELKGSSVKICTVIGFPLGASTTATKVFEARDAVIKGADEIDMVIDITAATEQRFKDVTADIAEVVKASKEEGKKLGKNIIVKTILETCFLDDDTITKCCLCAKEAGADFVKTSTGFAAPKSIDGKSLPNGANEHHIEIMRKAVGDDMGVKASGGVRTYRLASALIKAGASRIGTSSGINILSEAED